MLDISREENSCFVLYHVLI